MTTLETIETIINKYNNISRANFNQMDKATKTAAYIEIVTAGNDAVKYGTTYADTMSELFVKLFH